MAAPQPQGQPQVAQQLFPATSTGLPAYQPGAAPQQQAAQQPVAQQPQGAFVPSQVQQGYQQPTATAQQVPYQPQAQPQPQQAHGAPMQPAQQQPAAQQPAQPQMQPQMQPSPTDAAAAAPAAAPAPTPGLRWTFTTYPNTGKPKKSEASQWGPPTPEMVIPLAALYTPLHDTAHDASGDTNAEAPLIPVSTTADLPVCRSCSAHLNTFCRCDFSGGYWMCPACLHRNQLPAGLTEQHPALAAPTIEYDVQGEVAPAAPVYIFLIDVCIPTEELEPLKQSLLQAFEWLPEEALVGVITFGHSITLWEPGFEDLNKCYAFRGNRSYTKQELVRCLGIPNTQQPAQPQQQSDAAPSIGTGAVSGRFLVKLADAEFTLSSVLEELQVDPFTPAPKQRALRATGAALELAVSLLELVGVPVSGSRIMLFTGGPCTRGPGAIVSTDKSEMIRSHRDLLDGNAPLHAAACEFYQGLEARLSDSRIALDAITMSLDQVGLLEIRPCVDGTGGTMVCGDSFGTPMFIDSLKRVLARAKLRENLSQTTRVGCGFGAHLKVFTSSDTRVCGALGPCRARFGANAASTAQAQGEAKYISPIKIGVCETTQWVASAIDSGSTFTVVFDTEVESAPAGAIVEPSHGQQRFVQFVTTYTLPSGCKRVRVTSAAMPVARTAESSLYSNPGVFDQAAAAAVTSRLSIDVMEKHDNRPLDLTRRWIDRILVKFVKKFGSYRLNDPNSLRLASCFSLFPVFLFNLRRSEYFMLLNISPDETTFKRHYLRREPCDHCLLMIQPAVHSYDMYSDQPTPVPLDSESIKRENVLLMDAFFNVAVLRGSTVEEWRKANYQEQPEYAAFKSLLERPEQDAEVILTTRVPYPRYTNCDQHGSQARHVLTRLNPSVSHHSGVADSRSFGAGHKGPVQEVIYTDDASISKFMSTLKQAAVNPDY